MRFSELSNRLERCPMIAAIRDDKWSAALSSPVEVLFYLDAHLSTIRSRVEEAHRHNKAIFVHLDLAEGIGKDREGIRFLADCHVDGLISTKAQLIRMAKDIGILTVQRFFALDSQGMGSVQEMLKATNPHCMEIMPGVIPKIIKRFSSGAIPIIAGGLIETKGEITAALGSGAMAISTGCQELWYE